MRPIKFRAWTGNEMRYDIVGFDWDESFGVHNAWLGNNVEYNADNFLMNVLLLQYTGLKDKNGIEIYEGDIVETPSTKAKYLVDYVEGGFVGRIKYREYTTLYKGLKVIGNIYENPELLEEMIE